MSGDLIAFTWMKYLRTILTNLVIIIMQYGSFDTFINVFSFLRIQILLFIILYSVNVFSLYSLNMFSAYMNAFIYILNHHTELQTDDLGQYQPACCLPDILSLNFEKDFPPLFLKQ